MKVLRINEDKLLNKFVKKHLFFDSCSKEIILLTEKYISTAFYMYICKIVCAYK